ncbi:MAG TPA: hypothetical protein VN641_03505 [Urbifossiella sp.]|nr:hypothetical protein [Urbifossiella sp.]
MGALIFVPALVGCILFGFLFALFLARSYLNVLQSTGAGAKRVAWIAGPILDSFGDVFYLAWLIGLWLIPALFVGRVIAHGSDQTWLRYAVPLAVFWICYPVSQMSSLCGPSIWVPLHPDVFGRLVRKPHLVGSFLALSSAAIVALGLGFYWTFAADGMVTLVVGAIVFVVAMLFYARLLGRVAFVLMFTRSVFARKKKKKRDADSFTHDREVFSREAESAEPSATDADDDFIQPSELPPIHTPDEGPLHGYNVSFADERKPKKRIRAVAAEPAVVEAHPDAKPPAAADDDDLMTYVVHQPEVEPEAVAPREVIKPSEEEMRLLNRDDAPKPPKRIWSPDVFTFLFQPDSMAIAGLLVVLCLLAAGMVRIARAFNPLAGDS